MRLLHLSRSSFAKTPEIIASDGLSNDKAGSYLKREGPNGNSGSESGSKPDIGAKQPSGSVCSSISPDDLRLQCLRSECAGPDAFCLLTRTVKARPRNVNMRLPISRPSIRISKVLKPYVVSLGPACTCAPARKSEMLLALTPQARYLSAGDRVL
jgi:hypothetical protein